MNSASRNRRAENRRSSKTENLMIRFAVLAMIMILLTAAVTPSAHAQTYSVLYNFQTNSTDPSNPQYSGIVAQGRDGNLYSTAPGGGNNCGFCGAMFVVKPVGGFKVPYSFNDTTGSGYTPFSGLTLGTDGNLYGTTGAGGTFNLGTVIKISASGNLTKLYDFGTCKSPCKEGTYPKAPPVEGRDGNFYGTTPDTIDGTDNGVVYKVTPAGKFTTIYAFDGVSAGNPHDPLILGVDGNFYGTTTRGGIPSCVSNNGTCGTVFKITPGGKVTVLYKFDKTHGATPIGPLAQGSDGSLYGTTSTGGDNNGDGDGVIFKLTPTGKLLWTYSLKGSVDGQQPAAGLVQVTDGKGNTVALYGATTAGGSNARGTLFKITTAGAFSLVYDFANVVTGSTPEVTLVQNTNGILYGDTFQGGKQSAGVFYSLNDTLPAFVAVVSTSGKVGDSIQILGQGLNGTTAVSFNGKAASFKVISDTYLTATVPTGASKGLVTVKTPGGTLTSNHVFIVTPFIKSFNPTSGKVGTVVVITGGTFTGTTKVTFGGVPATNFKVNSDTQVTATVPTGAKTGKITITTPDGTAVSSGIFTVTQ